MIATYRTYVDIGESAAAPFGIKLPSRMRSKTLPQASITDRSSVNWLFFGVLYVFVISYGRSKSNCVMRKYWTTISEQSTHSTQSPHLKTLKRQVRGRHALL